MTYNNYQTYEKKLVEIRLYMGFIKKLKKYGKQLNNVIKNLDTKKPEQEHKSQDENVIRLLECGRFIDELTNSDRYVAKSEYLKPLEDYKEVIAFFAVLDKSGMLGDFCAKNQVTINEVEKITNAYNSIESLIEEHNNQYIDKALIEEKGVGFLYFRHLIFFIIPVLFFLHSIYICILLFSRPKRKSGEVPVRYCLCNGDSYICKYFLFLSEERVLSLRRFHRP